MELNEKLQQLRKQKNLTQEELAQALYVSRTAISKWESGRGYPSIDSLKAIAKFFGISVDEFLSGEQLLTLAEADHKQKRSNLCDLLFGLLDISVLLLLFLPLFGQKTDGGVVSVSLIAFRSASPLLQFVYYDFVSSCVIMGVLLLALQNSTHSFWLRSKTKLSLLLNIFGVFLFVVSTQVYVAVFLFVLLIIKASLLLKNQ
jgi:transcriptional regulator with XRE-family HTH domain